MAPILSARLSSQEPSDRIDRGEELDDNDEHVVIHDCALIAIHWS